MAGPLRPATARPREGQLPATELPAGDTAARVNLARPRRANDTNRRVGGGWSVCCLHDDSHVGELEEVISMTSWSY